MAFQFHYNDEQIKKYLIQFMMIFSEMQVSIGKNERNTDGSQSLIQVPIYNGNTDRVVGHILGDHTQNKLLRLPIMSTNITNIEMSPERRKGVGAVRRNSHAPVGGVIPNDVKIVRQQMPIPYNLLVDLSIWVSNQDQRYQILEQIMMLFDPIVQIQSSDSIFDWTKLTTVELLSINYEDNYPIGQDKRVLVSTLSFMMPIYISAPATIKDDFVKKIFARVGAVDFSSMTSQEIIDDLNAQGVEYQLVVDLDTLVLPEFGEKTT